MAIRQWFKSHGIGVSEIRTSWTGNLFDSTKKTPHTPYVPEARTDGVEREKIKQARVKSAVKDSSAGHMRYTESNVEEPVAGLMRMDVWRQALKDKPEKYFPNKAPGESTTNFAKQMTFVEQRLKDTFAKGPNANDPEARTLQGTNMKVLLDAVAVTCRTGNLNVDDAANALACLQHMDLLGAIAGPASYAAAVPNPARHRKPQRADGKPFTQADVANAWRLAAALEDPEELESGDKRADHLKGDAGFKLLTTLTKAPTTGGHLTVTQQRDALLHTYLRTARGIAREAEQAGIDIHGDLSPGSLHHYVNSKFVSPPGTEPGIAPADNIHSGRMLPAGATVLDMALKAVTNHMRQVQEHSAGPDKGKQITFDPNAMDVREGVNPGTYKILPKDCNWWAANFVRNGIYTDDATETRFSKNESRTDKVSRVARSTANFVRHGTYRDSDVNTRFSKNESRADKVNSVWMPRSKKSPDGVKVKDLSEETSKLKRMRYRIKDRAVRSKDWTKEAGSPRQLYDKTPLRAMKNVVAKSPELLLGATDASGITDGQMIRQDLIWNLEKAISNLLSTQHPAGQPIAAAAKVPDNPSVAVLKQMVRLAILKQQYRFNDKANGAHLFITRHLDGDALEGKDIALAKARVYEMFSGGRAAQSDLTRALIDELLPDAEETDFADTDTLPGSDAGSDSATLSGSRYDEMFLTLSKERSQNVQLSPERLAAWANEAEGPARLDEKSIFINEDAEGRKTQIKNAIAIYRKEAHLPPADWSHPDWNKFMDALDQVLLGNTKDVRHSEKDWTTLSDTEAAEFFEDLLKRQKLGHLIGLKSGGWIGGKTQGLSYLLTKIASLTVLGLGPDLRYSRGRHAVIEQAIGTSGRQVFVGTDKGSRMQAGMGISVGPGHASKKGEGFSIGLAVSGNVTPFSREKTERRGTVFRFRRVFSGVDSDDIGARQEARLDRKLKDPDHDPSAADGGAWIRPPDTNHRTILKEIMHEFPDVSVNWLDSKTTAYKSSASINGIAGLTVGGWGPGVGVGAGASYARSKTEWREDGGSLNQERDSRSMDIRGSVSGLLTIVAATMANLNLPADAEHLNDLLNPEVWSGAFKGAFHDGAVAGADIYKFGVSDTNTWISHDGALNYTAGICSFYTRTHKNGASFAASVVPKLAAFAQDKAKFEDAARYYHAQGEDGAEALANANERIRLINQKMTKMLEFVHHALTKAEPTHEFREYWEMPSRYLQQINDLYTVIKGEKSHPGWDKDLEAKARIKAYEKQLKKLKSLDHKAIDQHDEMRFFIRDNVETKTKGKGLNTVFVNWTEDTVLVKRIDTYI